MLLVWNRETVLINKYQKIERQGGLITITQIDILKEIQFFVNENLHGE